VAHGPLLLIGLRCSGKTTLGRALAKAAGVTWTDLDPHTLGLLACSSVHEAFERHGEAGWRQAEARALSMVLDAGHGVISLGGGTPTAPAAAATIRTAQARGRAMVALLDPGPAELLRRLAGARGDRPVLAKDDREEVRRLGAARLPLYRSLADLTVDSGLPPARCVDRLLAAIRTRRWPWPLAVG
jgi:shikimate kinase